MIPSGLAAEYQHCSFQKVWNGLEGDYVGFKTTRVVTMKMCSAYESSNGNTKCSSGNDYYYMSMDMGAYVNLRRTAIEEKKEKYCDMCDECPDADEEERRRLDDEALYDATFCSACYNTCAEDDEDEDDATAITWDTLVNYIGDGEDASCNQLEPLYATYDSEGEEINYYAGIACEGTSGLQLSVFTDAYCTTFSDKTIYEITGMTYDSSILEPLYDSSLKTCDLAIGYSQQEWYVDGMNANDEVYEGTATDYCTNIWAASAHCGFGNFATTNTEDVRLCNFITAILKGQYIESGDIELQGENAHGFAVLNGATKSQKVALGVFVPFTVFIGVYASYLYGLIHTESVKNFGATKGAGMLEMNRVGGPTGSVAMA